MPINVNAIAPARAPAVLIALMRATWPPKSASSAGSQRERKACAPQDRRRKHRKRASQRVVAEHQRRRHAYARQEQRRRLPVRQHVHDCVRAEGDGGREQRLDQAERTRRPSPAREARSHQSADAKTREEHREDQRERVDAGAEQQRQLTRPHHLGAERREAAHRRRDVDGRHRSLVGRGPRRFNRDVISLRAPRHHKKRDCDHGVDRHRHRGRSHGVVDAQQEEAGEERARGATHEVRHVETIRPTPLHALVQSPAALRPSAWSAA